MARIFGDPSPPRKITEKQFDDAQADLVATASKPWHQIDQSDYWHYLLDLCYVELQQDLFDYLFPAFLIKWWEGQLDRRGGPESECDFYRAIDHGEVFTKMMGETRRNEVFHWIVDAYMDGVDAWDGHLSVAYVKDGPDNLHGPLWSFNALGQSVPVLSALIERLSEVSTIGRAQWWLVLGSGILWKENECPAIPSWTPVGGGGGVYLTGSAASIFDHGYLPANLGAIRECLDYQHLVNMLKRSWEMIPSFPHGDWAQAAYEECLSQPERAESRIAKFMRALALPHLGGVNDNPLDSAD